MGYSTNAYYTLVIHEDAYKDLDSIFEVDEDTGGEIVALLELLRSNQDLLDRLTQRGFQNYGVPHFTVDEWQEARRSKFNLWRIRQLSSADAGQYRIIYAFHPQELRYFVLAILNRNFVYDTSIQRVKRIFDLYDACNIPRY
jgi:mRNA-degrading endonuclease RelE of RelBE toxin-antitoxin system